MPYTFDPIFAVDPGNPANVAADAEIIIFEPGDTLMNPLTLTTPDGLPFENPVTTSSSGHAGAFVHESLGRVAWSGGGFTGFFTAYDDIKQEAVAAKDAATVSASAAADSAQAARDAAALVDAPADTVLADLAGNPDSQFATQLSATIVEGVEETAPAVVGALNVTNLAGLHRWAAARGKHATGYARITVPGDSITHGVGSDGTSGEISTWDPAQQATYRANSWPSQLRKLLNWSCGAKPAENFVGLRPGFGGNPTLSGVSGSSSVGPWGQFAISGRGGYAVPASSTITFPAAGALGVFTYIEVYYWGSDSGVSNPHAPLVTIDGVAQPRPAGVQGGNINRIIVSGLAETTHEVIIGNDQSGATSYVYGVHVRNGTRGYVVNRMGAPGAVANDAAGSSTGATRSRMLNSLVGVGLTDLLILSLGTNDQGNQIPIADYKADLQEIIDVQVTAGGCVLLLGEPPAANPTGVLTEDDYRNAMRELALANTHVAYTDVRDLYGAHAEAFGLGLYPTSSTVHPSAQGAGVIATALTQLLTLPRYRA